MRVCHSSEVASGGVARHLALILPRLVASGVDCSLVLPREASESLLAQALREAGVSMHFASFARRRGALAALAVPTIRRMLAEESPDVVHTHATFAGVWGRMASARLQGVGVVHTPHALPLPRYSDALRRYAVVRLERWLARNTNAYVVVSEGQAELARTGYGLAADRLTVVPNGLPTEFGERILSRCEARRELGGAVDGDAPSVLFAGRLVAQKGPDLLLEAVGRCRCPPRLFLAGTGPMEARLTAKARALGLADSITFLGEFPEIRRCLRAFDAVAVPSRYEGLPYILLEALAAGLPVIASDIPGNRVPGLEDGRIQTFPGGDAQALAEKLQAVRPPSDKIPPGNCPEPCRLPTQVRALKDVYERCLRHP